MYGQSSMSSFCPIISLGRFRDTNSTYLAFPSLLLLFLFSLLPLASCTFVYWSRGGSPGNTRSCPTRGPISTFDALLIKSANIDASLPYFGLASARSFVVKIRVLSGGFSSLQRHLLRTLVSVHIRVIGMHSLFRASCFHGEYWRRIAV